VFCLAIAISNRDLDSLLELWGVTKSWDIDNLTSLYRQLIAAKWGEAILAIIKSNTTKVLVRSTPKDYGFNYMVNPLYTALDEGDFLSEAESEELSRIVTSNPYCANTIDCCISKWMTSNWWEEDKRVMT
jgi:hypothetical protein